MKTLAIILVLVGALFTAIPSSQAQEPVVRIVAGAFPPFRYIAQDQQKRGIDYEIVVEAFKLMGREVSFEFLPFLRALNEVKQGQAHGIAALTINQERKGFIRFSEPVSYVRDIFFAKKGVFAEEWHDFGEFQSYRVGKAKGYNYHASFLEYPFQNLAELVSSDVSPEQKLMRALAGDRLDVAICEFSVCNYILLNNPGLGEKIEPLKGDIGPLRSFHIGFSKAHPEARALQHAFDQALDALRQNGTLLAIYQKYAFVAP